ncbi:hypothetical protein V2G26_004713 [Clonostachys chloroleuca]
MQVGLQLSSNQNHHTVINMSPQISTDPHSGQQQLHTQSPRAHVSTEPKTTEPKTITDDPKKAAGENNQSSLTPMERYIRQTPNEVPWNHVWAGMRDNDK